VYLFHPTYIGVFCGVILIGSVFAYSAVVRFEFRSSQTKSIKLEAIATSQLSTQISVQRLVGSKSG